MKRLLLTTAGLSLATAAHGAEIIRRDLQFSVATAPTSFDYTITSPSGDFSGSDGFDAAWMTRLGGRWAFTRPGWVVAPVAGIDLQYRSASYAGGGGLSGRGLALTAGGAWAITDRWSTDLEFALSFEQASLDLGGTSPLTGDGSMTGTELRLRGVYMLNRSWSAGLETGWQSAQGSFTANQQREVDLTIGGYSVGLMVIWRMSMRPAGLE